MRNITVLGIDPGISACGIALVAKKRNRFILEHASVLRTKHQKKAHPEDTEDPRRLYEIFCQLKSIVVQFLPSEASVEQLLFAKNRLTAIQVAQARGAILALLGEHKLPTYTYSPLDVKKTLTGYGAAEKKQVNLMVQRFLQLKKRLPEDAADAAALALCHLFHREMLFRLSAVRKDSLLASRKLKDRIKAL